MAASDEVYVAMEIQQELMRWLPNVADLIAGWRAQVAGGDATIGPNMTAAAKGLLGRLLRLFNFAQAEPAMTDAALAVISMTRANVAARVTAFRDAMRIFRDAPKTTAPEITSALNALEAALPVQKRFLSTALPTDW